MVGGEVKALMVFCFHEWRVLRIKDGLGMLRVRLMEGVMVIEISCGRIKLRNGRTVLSRG